MAAQSTWSGEPGRYIASAAVAGLAWLPPRFLMYAMVAGQVSVELRLWYQKKNWEGHWIEFDVPAAGELKVSIEAAARPMVEGHDLLFTDIAVRRLGDLPNGRRYARTTAIREASR